MYPNKFRYVLIKDGGVTGNLEITCQKNSGGKFDIETRYEDNGKQFHTKQGGDRYPSSDWERFHERLENIMSSA